MPSRGLLRRGTRSSRRPQSLLILHLDAKKLRADHLHLGEVAGFSSALAAVAFGSDVVNSDVTDTAHLLDVLGELAADGRTFDVVVVVAHGNSAGIQMASDKFEPWDVFAKYLAPFRPRRLLLAACQAGRYDAGETLFRANPLLRRIFACPVNASKDFATMMLLAVPWIVSERRPRDNDVLLSQIATIALTGRQLREWRRVTDRGNPDSSLLDLFAVLADPIARQVPRTVRSVLNSLFGK